MNVSEIIGFEPATLLMPTAVAQNSDVQSLAKAVSDMAAGASVALQQENGASEADAKQAMQETTCKEYTAKFKPDLAKLTETTGTAETSAGDINPQARASSMRDTEL